MIRSEIDRIIHDLSIDAWGVARLSPVAQDHQEYLSSWLHEGMNADMAYLARNHHIRTSPTEGILEGAQSVIVCAFSHYPTTLQPANAPQVSKYAYGKDYHTVVRGVLQTLGERIGTEVAEHSFRAIVDTVPFLERYWAQQAGIGFIGKNKNLIIPGKGSFVFLGELLTTLTLEPSTPMTQRCGACHRCIDACPTSALRAEGLDARRCISYLTIEHKGEISDELTEHFGRRFYGCDTCQDVCPFNHRPTPQRHFAPSDAILHLSRHDLHTLSPDRYRSLFRDSAASRAKYPDMLRNANIWLSNNPLPDPPKD